MLAEGSYRYLIPVATIDTGRYVGPRKSSIAFDLSTGNAYALGYSIQQNRSLSINATNLAELYLRGFERCNLTNLKILLENPLDMLLYK
jgi:hypothetical protein